MRGWIRCSLARSSARSARLSALAAGTPRTGWRLAPSPSTSSWARDLTRSRGGARTCSAPSGCSRLITLPPRPGSSSESGNSRCRSVTRRCSSRLISRPSLFRRLWSTAGFDSGQPALFSWTGVAPYLTAQAIESTLRTIAGAAAGSEVVFSYRAEESVLDDVGKEFIRIYAPLAASVGEPLQPGWPVIEIERLISRCGLKVVDHPARADLEHRYFAGRTDGLRPYTAETLVTAQVL